MGEAESLSRQGPRAPLLRAVLLVFVPFSGGFFLSELFRSVNAVIAPLLVADARLSAADLGLLTSAFFVPFALFQIPLGLLLDRFGARRVQAVLLLFTALGAFLFSIGPGLPLLAFGRALIGFGLAGGLMGALKALSLWFPARSWPLVNGCFFAIGGLGAITATMPVDALVGIVGWRGVFQGLALAVLLVAAAIFFVVPERDGRGEIPNRAQLFAGLGAIYGEPMFWRVTPLAAVSLGTYMGIQGLWAGPWLKDVAGLDSAGVARYLLFTAIAVAVGYFNSGFAAEMLRRVGVGARTVMGGGVVLFMAAQGVLIAELDPGALWPWLLFGLTGNAAMLAYAYLTSCFPLDHAGRVNTCLNLVVFVAAFLAQYVAGAIIEAFPLSPDGGYARESYRWAFGALLAAEALAFLWYCRPLRGRGAG